MGVSFFSPQNTAGVSQGKQCRRISQTMGENGEQEQQQQLLVWCNQSLSKAPTCQVELKDVICTMFLARIPTVDPQLGATFTCAHAHCLNCGTRGDFDYIRQAVCRHSCLAFLVVFFHLKIGHNSIPLFGRFCNTVFL